MVRVSLIHTFVDVHRPRRTCWVREPGWHFHSADTGIWLAGDLQLTSSLSVLYQFCFNNGLSSEVPCTDLSSLPLLWSIRMVTGIVTPPPSPNHVNLGIIILMEKLVLGWFPEFSTNLCIVADTSLPGGVPPSWFQNCIICCFNNF